MCTWHKNQHLAQIGDKLDEASWNPYETCRIHGGMITTGHEHSYARSHLLAHFDPPNVTSTFPSLQPHNFFLIWPPFH